MVLFLGFNEGCNDFFNVSDARSLFDLFKRVLNYANVTNVLVHELLLLFIGGYHLVKTKFKNGNGVAEVTAACATWTTLGLVSCLLVRLVEILVLKFDHLIFYLEAI